MAKSRKKHSGSWKTLFSHRKGRIGLVAVLILVVLFFSLFRSCSRTPHPLKKNVYYVARDSSVAPLQLMGKETSMRAFSDDLIYAIASAVDLQVIIMTVGIDNLLTGLDEGDYDAIFTALSPNAINEEKYFFSNPYYLLGPVLIVRKTEDVTSLEQMEGKIIGILTGASAVFNVDRYPSILIVTYDNPSAAFDALINDKIDGIVLDAWSAYTYIKGFYGDRLKIASGPLTNFGLRLVARNEADEAPLIQGFNKGLDILKANGTYKALVTKWGLFDIEMSIPEKKETSITR